MTQVRRICSKFSVHFVTLDFNNWFDICIFNKDSRNIKYHVYGHVNIEEFVIRGL